MLRVARNLLLRTSFATRAPSQSSLSFSSSLASSPSLSIWRRKKEMGKEGLIVAKELKRLHTDQVRLDRFIKSHVSRLLKSDLVSVLAEFQRQDQVFLCMKVSTLCQLFFLLKLWFLIIVRWMHIIWQEFWIVFPFCRLFWFMLIVCVNCVSNTTI